MSDKQKTNLGKPIDPTTNASEMIGDPTGLTGVTTDLKQNVVVEDQDESTPQTMSSTRAAMNEDRASEKDMSDIDAPTLKVHLFDDQQKIPESKEVTTIQAANHPTTNPGELSVSGSTPDPESDDDTLANIQAMGMQLEEDEEHPQELNLARDIDKAEEDFRTH